MVSTFAGVQEGEWRALHALSLDLGFCTPWCSVSAKTDYFCLQFGAMADRLASIHGTEQDRWEPFLSHFTRQAMEGLVDTCFIMQLTAQ